MRRWTGWRKVLNRITSNDSFGSVERFVESTSCYVCLPLALFLLSCMAAQFESFRSLIIMFTYLLPNRGINMNLRSRSYNEFFQSDCLIMLIGLVSRTVFLLCNLQISARGRLSKEDAILVVPQAVQTNSYDHLATILGFSQWFSLPGWCRESYCNGVSVAGGLLV